MISLQRASSEASEVLRPGVGAAASRRPAINTAVLAHTCNGWRVGDDSPSSQVSFFCSQIEGVINAELNEGHRTEEERFSTIPLR